MWRVVASGIPPRDSCVRLLVRRVVALNALKVQAYYVFAVAAFSAHTNVIYKAVFRQLARRTLR